MKLENNSTYNQKKIFRNKFNKRCEDFYSE